MEYADQLSWKQALVVRLLGRFCRVSPILGMEDPQHYRCKVQAAFGVVRGKFVSGIYQSSTHHIVQVEHLSLIHISVFFTCSASARITMRISPTIGISTGMFLPISAGSISI